MSASQDSYGRTGTCKGCGESLVVPTIAQTERRPPFGVQVADEKQQISIDEHALKQLLRDKSARGLRDLAAFSLCELRRDDVIESLLSELNSPDNYKHCKAAEALGEIASADAAPTLVNALESESGERLLCVVEALELIREPSGLSAAAGAFANSAERHALFWNGILGESLDRVLEWEVPNYGAIQLYRRAASFLNSQDWHRSPKEEQIGASWYAGMYGLKAGVAPTKCLKLFERGINRSTPVDHPIVCDFWMLKYCLAGYSNDHNRANTIRRKFDKELLASLGGRPFESHLTQLIDGSLSLSSIADSVSKR
ncbi:MAG: HEAT repeat domain-containing protein [Gemmataceae bacterium]|nr:HEAT repeat domain-containing protein [Gemmataceae bacterium]